MQIGMIGLGRMGMNMTKRLLHDNHKVIVYDVDLKKVEFAEKEGAIGITKLEEIGKRLEKPRVVWCMLPAGKITEETIKTLSLILNEGDVIVDGSNGYYKDDLRRAKELGEKGIMYMDAGISGGIWGVKIGYCTMIGGPEEAFKLVEPAIKSLATEGGYLYCGPTGAGHFVKMVHNGIEYAIMEAYGEGFELLKASPYSKYFSLKDIAHLWNHGSVIRSWLLELLESAFEKDPELETIQGYVEDSGEARWTVHEAVDLGVSVTGIAHSLFKRFQSRQEDVFSDKVLAALRREFGGHAVYAKGKKVRTKKAGAGRIEHAKPSEEWKKPKE